MDRQERTSALLKLAALLRLAAATLLALSETQPELADRLLKVAADVETLAAVLFT